MRGRGARLVWKWRRRGGIRMRWWGGGPAKGVRRLRSCNHVTRVE